MYSQGQLYSINVNIELINMFITAKKDFHLISISQHVVDIQS